MKTSSSINGRSVCVLYVPGDIFSFHTFVVFSGWATQDSERRERKNIAEDAEMLNLRMKVFFCSNFCVNDK